MYLWAGLFSVSVILLLWQAGRLIYNWVRRHQNLEPLRFFVTYDGVLQDDALQFVFGIGGHYETRVANGLYKTTHTFLIGIKNASRNQFVSNCKVYLDIPDKDGSVPRSYLLVDTFTLNASEERYVPIVSYDEPATISSYKGSIIRLCIPVYGGFLNVGSGWPWQMPIGAYTFTLRATAKEVGVRDVVCKIWVDEAGKLHFERA